MLVAMARDMEHLRHHCLHAHIGRTTLVFVVGFPDQVCNNLCLHVWIDMIHVKCSFDVFVGKVRAHATKLLFESSFHRLRSLACLHHNRILFKPLRDSLNVFGGVSPTVAAHIRRQVAHYTALHAQGTVLKARG